MTPPRDVAELVVLPGLDGSSLLRREFVALMGKRLPVRVIDYAAAPAQDYASLTDWLLPQLPRRRACALLGESFGGPLALSVAARQRSAGALILCASFTRAPVRLLPDTLARVLAMASARAPAALIGWWLLNRLTGDQVAQLSACVHQLPPALLQQRLRAVLSVDVRAQTDALRLPLLVVDAGRDRLLVGARERWPAHTQHIRVDGPHSLLQVCPQAIAEHVGRFLGYP